MSSAAAAETTGVIGRAEHAMKEEAIKQLGRILRGYDTFLATGSDRQRAVAERIKALSLEDKMSAVESHLKSLGSASSSSSKPDDIPIFTALMAVLERQAIERQAIERSEDVASEAYLKALQAEKASIEALSSEEHKDKFQEIHTAMGIPEVPTEMLDKEIKRVKEWLRSMSATAAARPRAEAGASARELDVDSAKPKSKKVSDKLIAGIKSIGEIAAKPTLSAWGLTKSKTQQMASLTREERKKLRNAAQQVREAWESPVLTPAEIKRELQSRLTQFIKNDTFPQGTKIDSKQYSLADLQTAIISKLTSGMKEFRAGMVDEFDKLATTKITSDHLKAFGFTDERHRNKNEIATALVNAYSAKLEQKFGIKLSATDQATIAGVLAQDPKFTKAITASQNPDATKKSINTKAAIAALGTVLAASVAVGIIGVMLNFGLGVVGGVGLAMLTYYGAKKFMEWKRKRDVGKQITTQLESKMQELFSVEASKGKVAVKDGFLDALVEGAKKAFNVSKASAVVAGRATTTAGAAVGTGAVAVGGGALTAAAVAGTASPVVGAAAALASGGGAVAAGVAGVAVGLLAARVALIPITRTARKINEMGGIKNAAAAFAKGAVNLVKNELKADGSALRIGAPRVRSEKDLSSSLTSVDAGEGGVKQLGGSAASAASAAGSHAKPASLLKRRGSSRGGGEVSR
jgi:hypothetical protein